MTKEVKPESSFYCSKRHAVGQLNAYFLALPTVLY